MKSSYVASFLMLTLALSSTLSVADAHISLSTPQLTGRVRGTVVAPNESVIQNATVVLKGTQTTRKLTTDVNGVYEAELPTGIYEVTTEIPGWYPLRRARFCVQAGTLTMITLAPALRVESIALEVTTSGIRKPVTTLPPPKYDSLSVPHPQREQLDLLVQFFKKRARKGITEYGRATASYDALTISANVLRLNPKTLHIEAAGNVIIEHGMQRTHTQFAEVEFKAGKPTIKLIK